MLWTAKFPQIHTVFLRTWFPESSHTNYMTKYDTFQKLKSNFLFDKWPQLPSPICSSYRTLHCSKKHLSQMSCESIAEGGRSSFSLTKYSDKHSPASDIHFDYTQNSQPLSQYVLNMCITYIHIQSNTHNLTCQIHVQTLASYLGILQYFTHTI